MQSTETVDFIEADVLKSGWLQADLIFLQLNYEKLIMLDTICFYNFGAILNWNVRTAFGVPS